MQSNLRKFIALIVGFISGNLVNMFLIQISGNIVAPPEGSDLSTIEGLIAAMQFFEPKHFIMPFLAHALGTFSGALITLSIAKEQKMMLSMIIGLVFLILGAINVYMLPAPLWFNIVDLVFAYLPMAYIASKFIRTKKA